METAGYSKRRNLFKAMEAPGFRKKQLIDVWLIAKSLEQMICKK